MHNIEKLIEQYNLGKTLKITCLPSSGNEVFYILTSTGEFILRFNPQDGPRARSKDEILAEVELLQFLSSSDFPVSNVLHTRSGDFIIEDAGQFGYLRTYIPGKAKTDPSLKNIEQIGKLLGWFHTLSQQFKTTHKRNHNWDLEHTKKVLTSNQAILPPDFTKTISNILDQLNFPSHLPQGYLHEDLGRRHVLWDQAEIVGVIDFDRMYYGSLILDVGQTVRGWCFSDDWQNWDMARFHAFMRGYESKRKLESTECLALKDAVKFALVERALSFIIRSIEFSHNKDDAEFALHTINTLLPQLENAW